MQSSRSQCAMSTAPVCASHKYSSVLSSIVKHAGDPPMEVPSPPHGFSMSVENATTLADKYWKAPSLDDKAGATPMSSRSSAPLLSLARMRRLAPSSFDACRPSAFFFSPEREFRALTSKVQVHGANEKMVSNENARTQRNGIMGEKLDHNLLSG